MGNNTLSTVRGGYLADERYWNQYSECLNEDLYPRDNSGAVVDEYSDLGTYLKRFNELNCNKINIKSGYKNRAISTTSMDITTGNICKFSGTITYSGGARTFETKSFTCGSKPFCIAVRLYSAGNAINIWASVDRNLIAGGIGEFKIEANESISCNSTIVSYAAGTHTLYMGSYNSPNDSTDYDVIIFELT